MTTLTPDEAQRFLESAIGVCHLIEDSERPNGAAILRGHMNCGEALQLLGALIAMIADEFPELVEGPLADVASLYFRPIN